MVIEIGHCRSCKLVDGSCFGTATEDRGSSFVFAARSGPPICSASLYRTSVSRIRIRPSVSARLYPQSCIRTPSSAHAIECRSNLLGPRVSGPSSCTKAQRHHLTETACTVEHFSAPTCERGTSSSLMLGYALREALSKPHAHRGIGGEKLKIALQRRVSGAQFLARRVANF